MNQIYLLIGANFIWLILLTFYIYKINNHYQKLAKWSKKESLSQIVETIIDRYEVLDKHRQEMEKQLVEYQQDSQLYIKKVGLVRFNPFERIGGEQSFIVALLDNKNNGITLTFLYTRDGVRVYAKKIINGTCKEMELSDEEKEAIKKAS